MGYTENLEKGIDKLHEELQERDTRIRELEGALEQARNTMLTVDANSSLSFVKPINEIEQILNKTEQS